MKIAWCSGYHICLTHRRSQVRALVRSIFFSTQVMYKKACINRQVDFSLCKSLYFILLNLFSHIKQSSFIFVSSFIFMKSAFKIYIFKTNAQTFFHHHHQRKPNAEQHHHHNLIIYSFLFRFYYHISLVIYIFLLLLITNQTVFNFIYFYIYIYCHFLVFKLKPVIN